MNEDVDIPLDITSFSETYRKSVDDFEANLLKLRAARHAVQEQREKYFTGSCFVTLETKAMAEWLVKGFGKKKGPISPEIGYRRGVTTDQEGRGKGSDVDFKVRKAPLPSSVLWENLNATRKELVKARVWSYLITAFIVGLCLCSLLGLNYFQRSVTEKDLKSPSSSIFSGPQLRLRAISFSMTIIVTSVNAGLAFALRSLTVQEKHATTSRFFRSLSLKLALVQFCLLRLNS